MLDQLLSGYLDDALSADERARVERLLDTDREVANQLQQLEALQGSLREVSRADAQFTLPEGFSDRVLDAAVAAACNEGLTEDHPLVRLAEQPSTQQPRGIEPWRMASVLVALAASIVIAVIVMRPSTESTTIVDTENDPQAPEAVGPASLAEARIDAAVESPDAAIQPGPDPELIVATTDVIKPTSDAPIADGPNELTQTPLNQAPRIAQGDTPNPTVDSGTDITVADASPVSDPDMVANANLNDQPFNAVGPIMVLDIKQTDEGRQDKLALKRLRSFGIAAENEKSITDEIAGMVERGQIELVDDAADESTILYLEVSGKRFDELHVALLEENPGIESVRLGLAYSMPIRTVIRSARPIDPTQVRHTESWQLSSESTGYVDAFANVLLEESLFTDGAGMPGRRSTTSANRQPVTSNAPDIKSQVLVIIR